MPVLYITTAFSLMWGAAEKWVYPHMSRDILANPGIPSFGFTPVIFLMLPGSVEFGVAYLLLTGVLNRFLSLVVTMLLVTTSMVFLAEGTGRYITPVLWHRGTRMQLAFVGITLIPLTLGVLGLYIALA